MTLNEQMKICRIQAGMTVPEAAEATGYSTHTVYKIEEEKRKVPVFYLSYWVSRGLFDISQAGKYENAYQKGANKR